jgi:NADH dehydrogenase (ubiquinone) 1 alpha subcomplex subunit 5
MRATLRLFASVQRNAQFLEAGAPTGLAGLLTHSAPRTTLLYIYNDTLAKLQKFPEHSVYRQSTEALTKHRLTIIESVRPHGLEEWQARVAPYVESFPDAFKRFPVVSTGGKEYNIVWKETLSKDEPNPDDNVGYKGKAPLEGPRTESERKNQAAELAYDPVAEAAKIPEVEPEPPLTAEQIAEIENKIGAGLIEEVIYVAEGESGLVDIMLKNQV